MGETLSQILEPIASGFRSLGIPEPITHWGHPVMMGIVVFVMGSFAGYAGWRIRLADGEAAMETRKIHKKIALWMFLFICLGYTGGILSLVMQKQPLLESPHFWTGSTVIFLLGLNGAISLFGFGSNQAKSFRTVHAYLGSIALIVLLIHAFLGLNLGLSI